MNHLNKLLKYLDTNKAASESRQLKYLIKLAFINNARIVFNDSSYDILFQLVGDIKSLPHTFGQILINKISFKIDFYRDILNTNNLFVIHAPGISDTYHNLGYGKDLYLAAIKYAKESDGSIISFNKSGDAKKVYKRLQSLPGITVTNVLYIERNEHRIAIPLSQQELSAINENEQLLENRVDYFKITHQNKNFYQSLFPNLMLLLPDKMRSEYHAVISHIVSASSEPPISIPVVSIKDDPYFKQYEGELKNEYSPFFYDKATKQYTVSNKELQQYLDDRRLRDYTVKEIRGIDD